MEQLGEQIHNDVIIELAGKGPHPATKELYYRYYLSIKNKPLKEEQVSIIAQVIEKDLDRALVCHGRWVDWKGNPVPWTNENKNMPSGSCYCSICNHWLTASDEYDTIGLYCPNCGSKMDLEE